MATTTDDDAEIPRLLIALGGAERILCASRATLYRLIAAERFAAVKVGGAMRITMESIERYVASVPPADTRPRCRPGAAYAAV